ARSEFGNFRFARRAFGLERNPIISQRAHLLLKSFGLLCHARAFTRDRGFVFGERCRKLLQARERKRLLTLDLRRSVGFGPELRNFGLELLLDGRGGGLR